MHHHLYCNTHRFFVSFDGLFTKNPDRQKQLRAEAFSHINGWRTDFNDLALGQILPQPTGTPEETKSDAANGGELRIYNSLACLLLQYLKMHHVSDAD